LSCRPRHRPVPPLGRRAGAQRGAGDRRVLRAGTRRAAAGYELLICYDFEADSTLPAVAALPPDRKPEAIRLVKNTLGPGVRYAIEASLRAAEAPVVVVMMADVSDDFSRVGAMVE
jgi:hypothetical protein